VQDYLTGMRRVDISAKYDLFPTQIYAYLRRRGVQANRHAKHERTAICSVCGVVRPMPPYSPSNQFRTRPTCGDPACLALMTFRPELRLRAISKVYPFKGRPGATYPWEFLAEAETYRRISHLDATELATLERAFQLGVDERGHDITEGARNSLWGKLSELSIAVHLRSTGLTDTALTLSRKQPLHEFLRRFFGRDVELAAVTAAAFDVVYLWRCGCPQQEGYVIRSLAEFPSRPGDYGVCTMCASSALVIE
jgi:hypothetical protein